MSRSHHQLARASAAALTAIVIALLGCSTESPTAPVQQPAPSSGGQPSAAWSIIVKSTPKELTSGSTNPATVSVTVRRVDDNQPPPQGTTIVLSTSLGEFNAIGSGLTSIALVTVNGRADAFLFAGAIPGTALLTARLEASAGQLGLPILEPIEEIEASFEFANSNGNLSVQFADTSTGGPTKWRWDFGDGATSKEQNPSHLYAFEGDYVVTLTASKRNSEDTTSQIVSVTEDPDEVVTASFEFEILNREVLFRDTSTGNPTRWRWDFGDGTASFEQNPRHLYNDEGNYVVTLTASNARTEDTTSQIVSLTEEIFITDVTPEEGGAGTVVTITGQGFFPLLRVLFAGVPVDSVLSSSRTQIVVVAPDIPLETETCDDDEDGFEGTRFLTTLASVTVEKEGGVSGTIPAAFEYVGSPICFND